MRTVCFAPRHHMKMTALDLSLMCNMVQLQLHLLRKRVDSRPWETLDTSI